MKKLISVIALVFACAVLGAADDAGKRPPTIEVTVTGKVSQPGVLRLRVEEKPTLTNAIARAGAFTRMADRRGKNLRCGPNRPRKGAGCGAPRRRCDLRAGKILGRLINPLARHLSS